MAVHDFTSQRLYVEEPLNSGATVSLSRGQANYLLNVLRMRAGEEILHFNGRDGEWRCSVEITGKRACDLRLLSEVRSQQIGPEIHFLFAPLKRARLDYMVQKATELGVRSIEPVITERTVVDRVNLERMQANVIEAAEQCGILYLPEVKPPEKLPKRIESWDSATPLIFCDEAAETTDPLRAMSEITAAPVAVLIGPEGGFTEHERTALLALPFTVPISLGPRIMRADTAAVAALSLVNAILGDWASKPAG